MSLKVVVNEDDWLRSSLLEGVESIPVSMEGAFYPWAPGTSRIDDAHPSVYGWAVRDADAQAFNELFEAEKYGELAEAFPGCFSLVDWVEDASGILTATVIPAPVHADDPLGGHLGEAATWARFASFGPESLQFDIRCDLASGRCRIDAIGDKPLPVVEYRVMPAKLKGLATMRSRSAYAEDVPGVPMFYDGGYWQYALGSDSAVLLRGTRRRTDKNRDEPIKDLFHKICRSGLKQMRAAWSFTL